MTEQKPLVEKWNEEFKSSARILMLNIIEEDLEKLFEEPTDIDSYMAQKGNLQPSTIELVKFLIEMVKHDFRLKILGEKK